MNTTKTLYSGIVVDTLISTSERIFQVETYDNETVLCNLKDAQAIIKQDVCKGIRHYWRYKFVRISKKEVLEIPL